MNVTDFGKLVKKLREESGLTQAQLAERLGCSDNHLSKVEQGTKMSVDLWMEVCKEFDLPAISFIDDGSYEQTLSNELMSQLKVMDEKQLKAIFDFLRTMENS